MESSLGYLELSVSDDPLVEDRFQRTYGAMLLAGIGFLLPYNVFITAVDYYHARFPASTIVFDMNLVYLLVALAAVLLNNALVESFSLQTRILSGYGLSVLVMLLVCVLDVGLELFSTETSYRLTLVAVGTLALGCTVQQSSFYGYASMLPRRYSQAVMTGESAAGVLSSFNRIVTKAFVHNDRANTLAFFCLGVAIIVASCATFQCSRNSAFVQGHLLRCRAPQRVDVSSDNEVVFAGTMEASSTRCFRRLNAAKRGLQQRWSLTHAVWPNMLAIALAYLVTQALFPGIESEIGSCALGEWMAIVLMAVFNATDFVGKLIALAPIRWSRAGLIGCTSARMLLIPLLMLCALPRRRPVIRGEAWPILLSAMLGASNGYFGSVPMITAPGEVANEHKELTGNLMMLSYSVGLTSGSGLAYLLDTLLGPADDMACFRNGTGVG